jgi:NhaP-type Na+/H+ or K+/H+ antiporter
MFWKNERFHDDHEVIISENCLIFLLLLLTCLICQHYIQRYYYYFPSTGFTLLLSMFIGGLIRIGNGTHSVNNSHSESGEEGSSSQYGHPFMLGFSSEIFYFGLLPPILFYSGFYLKRKYFFTNLDYILSLAFLGTICSILIISFGIHCYLQWNYPSSSSSVSSVDEVSSSPEIVSSSNTDIRDLTIFDTILLGTILSSTDPVTTLAIYSNLNVHYQLYYLVFGESILNDAVSVTMYKSLLRSSSSENGNLSISSLLWLGSDFFFIFLISSIIGYCLGIGIAFLMKYFQLFQQPIKKEIVTFHPYTNTSHHSPFNTSTPNPFLDSPLPIPSPLVDTEDELDNQQKEETPVTQQQREAKEQRQDEEATANDNELICLLFLLFICYFSFFLGETLQLSGIVTIFFSGISTRKYILKNISIKAIKILFTKIMELFAYLMETSCFIIVGISIFLIDFQSYHIGFIFIVFGLCFLARMVVVYFLLSVVIDFLYSFLCPFFFPFFFLSFCLSLLK